jgi:transcriptional regulator with XRE-family HTH domain
MASASITSQVMDCGTGTVRLMAACPLRRAGWATGFRQQAARAAAIMGRNPTMAETQGFGAQLRGWRLARRLSQLDLALEAGVSARHISFLETGRAEPSREMVARLAESLSIPLRDRNRLMIAAGFAPVYAERDLDDPDLAPAREAIDLILRGHEPFPALAVDRHWNLVSANAAALRLMRGLPGSMLVPPVNVLRISLSPAGLAPRIVNLPQWRSHILARLAQQIDASADPQLMALHAELAALPRPASDRSAAPPPASARFVLPFSLMEGDTILEFISTTTLFGTPVDVTLSEIAIESFFPANESTAEFLRSAAQPR